MKRRAESAFGLHFDFHATPAPGRVVGATLCEEDIREICRLIRPDFIQIDCKGHPGWTSYPTELGNAMPAFATDTLALWRRVTREEGVALYMHYSGVFDSRYCAEHPEEAAVHADGSRSDKTTRTLGHYADDLLIPQLKELADKYSVDGVWVDGECWSTCADFHPETVAAFEKETGIDLGGKLPAERGDPYFDEYRDFCRELFRRYLRHYTDAVHAAYPDFQIASNWAFSDHMPEAVTADVDFLSGDFSPMSSLNSARYSGRALAQQGHTWDLMAWNFRWGKSDRPSGLPKHPVQVMQEAATVLAVGGGFQNYITQYPDGTPRMEQIRRMKPVADFIRAREPYCFRGKAAHNATVLISQYDRYKESTGLFSRTGHERTAGLVALFCDAGQPVEMNGEHTLHGHCGDYALIAVPELTYGLESSMIDELIAYAEAGGSLLLTGPNTCRIFSERLPYKIEDLAHDGGWRWISLDREEMGYLQNAHTVRADGETVLWYGETEKQTDLPGAVILPYGKGKIAVLAADIGKQYLEYAQFMHRKVLRALCDRLYTPSVRIEHALGLLETVDLYKEGKRFIQLINANGNHASPACATEDHIPPAVDITVSVAAEKKPAAMILQPSGKPLIFTYRDGRATVDIKRVDIQEIIEIVNE
ncbi:MAG: hypothetical protein IJW99_06330 [Clostridia bacterium]|nr:hypothetical protein [Clostridia bacterium]